MIGQWEGMVGLEVLDSVAGEEREGKEKGQRKRTWKPIWSRTTWPGEAAGSKGSHSWGIN